MFRRLKALIILAGFCAACGGPVEEAKPTESALGWIGTARIAGAYPDYYTCPGGEVWYINQPVTQSYTRPISGATNYYTVSLADDGQPWSVDYARNQVRLTCSSYKVPVSPVCGSNGAICSTGGAVCSVYTRWHGGSTWQYSGYVQAGALVYRPDLGARGNYLIALPNQVQWGSGNGFAINGCGVGGQISFSFGG